MLAQKYQKAQGNCGGCQAGSDQVLSFVLFGILGFGSIRILINFVALFVGDEARGAKPQVAGKQRKIVKTSGVVNLQVDGDIEGQRREHAQRGSAEKIEIDHSPRPAAAQPKRAKSQNDEHVLNRGNQIVGVVVLAEIGFGPHPWQNDESVKKNPPGQQQNEIQISKTNVQFIFLEVRAKDQRGHQRNSAQ